MTFSTATLRVLSFLLLLITPPSPPRAVRFSALQPTADFLHLWCSTWKVSLSTSKSVVSYFSLDPRETNGKAQPTTYFGPEKVSFESTPPLLGVTLDCQLTFGPHTDQLKKKISGRLKVLRSLSGRSWGPISVITQVTLLYLCSILYLIVCIILAGIHR